MENVGWKGLAVTLYQRVILSYRSTFVGIGIAAGAVLVENLVHSPNKVLTIVGSVLGGLLSLVKSPTLTKPS